jgi:sulfur relay (sulfurtransferase) complex TusBCD TusD component (DsrE family)
MVTIAIFLGQGPYTAERPFTALRFAYTALLDNNKVKMFFVEDGIWCIKKGQDPSNIYKIEEWVQKCLDEGAEMVACGVCMKARGMVDAELIPGIKKGTMEMAVEMVKTSDKQLFF